MRLKLIFSTMMRWSGRTLALSAIVLSFVVPTHASEGFTRLQLAVLAGQWAEADGLAARLDIDEQSGDFFKLYAAAAQRVGAGRCAEAQPAFAALLSVRPNFVPAREMMFICHSVHGNRSGAESELSAMLALLPEGPQRTLIEQTLRDRRADDGPALSGYVEIRPSTNINRQTSATHIGGWTIGAASRGQDGVELRSGVALTQRLFSQPGFAMSGVVKTDVAWSSAAHLLRPSLTLETPMTFTTLDKSQFLATPFVTAGFQDTRHAYTRIGARGVFSMALTTDATFGATGQLYRTQYELTPWRDGWGLEASVSLSLLLDEQTRLSATLSANRDHTDISTNRTLDVTAALRLDHMMESGLVVGLEGSVGQRNHSSPPPLSLGPDQRDNHVAARIELSHRDFVLGPFLGANVRPGLYYEYSHQDSDSVFYRFDSHDVGVTMRLAF